jgi:hypothetical protein
MEQIGRLVDMKTEAEIIRTEVEKSTPHKNWEDVVKLIDELDKNRKVRFNDSLFIFTDRGHGVASFAMCNADSLEQMPKSLKQFFDYMKDKKFVKLVCESERRAMLRVAEKTGYKGRIIENGKNGVRGEVYLNV